MCFPPELQTRHKRRTTPPIRPSSCSMRWSMYHLTPDSTPLMLSYLSPPPPLPSQVSRWTVQPSQTNSLPYFSVTAIYRVSRIEQATALLSLHERVRILHSSCMLHAACCMPPCTIPSQQGGAWQAERVGRMILPCACFVCPPMRLSFSFPPSFSKAISSTASATVTHPDRFSSSAGVGL